MTVYDDTDFGGNWGNGYSKRASTIATVYETLGLFFLSIRRPGGGTDTVNVRRKIEKKKNKNLKTNKKNPFICTSNVMHGS